MKIIGSILMFLFCTFTVSGQKNLVLSGTLLDKSDNQPVIGSTIELLNSKDSTFVSGNISNLEGAFSFKNLSPGSYIIKVSSIGYHTLKQNVNLIKENPSLNLGKIYLDVDEILLQEAVIEGKRPEVIVKNDTIEYDAGSYKVTENAVVEDLLKKLPGVEVDKEGTITVNGKEVKKFLVDSKEFFSDDPQIASKNLPAEMVEKLQVVDRKSEMARTTGFDDGEEETIINLTIKPGMKKGTMGNALLGGGKELKGEKDFRYQGAGFLNHMRGNDRFSLILGANNNNNMGAADLGSTQFGGMRMRRGGGGITETSNFMLSINKEFSEKMSLNSDVRYTNSERNSISKVEQATLSDKRSQFDRTRTNNTYDSDNLSANFNFEWKPDTANTLTIRPNIRYNKSKSYEDEYLTVYNYNNMDTISDSYTKANNRGEGLVFGGELNYAHRFIKPGRVFSISIRGNYNDSYSYEDSYWISHRYKEGIYENDSISNQRSEQDDTSSNFRVTTSWVEPLKRNNFLQITYRIVYNDIKRLDSTYDVYKYDPFFPGIPVDTAIINPDQSVSTLRNSFEQRIGINFKAVRKNYNYTIGFNVDPTHSTNKSYQPSESYDYTRYLPVPYDFRLPNILGDSLISSTPLNVVNFSPVVNMMYLFDKRTNLRIDYEGKTDQPSANQLRNYIDKTRPTQWQTGNPGLKPSYENEIRIRFSKYVEKTQLAYNISLNGDVVLNDIVSTTEILDDGVRLSSYKNVNGNWNGSLQGMFNMPLRNKKFTIGSFGMINYRNQNSFVDDVKNTMKNLAVRFSVNANYRSDLFDVGIRTNINYNDIEYTVNPEKNQNTFNYGLTGYTTWYLPKNLVIESDISWTARSGYAAGFNVPEVMWNAAITKQLFSKSYGVGSIKLQVYDILHDRNNITSSYTDNGFRTSEVNVIPSYCMCSFIYKFTSFPKGSGSDKNEGTKGGENRRGPRGSRGRPSMF